MLVISACTFVSNTNLRDL